MKPEVARHEGLFEAEKETGFPLRFTWVMLPTICDREGRFKWRPRALKQDVLPYDEVDFSAVLEALLARGFVVKYRVGSEWFGCIPTFNKHQQVNAKESVSTLPDLQAAEELCTRGARTLHASTQLLDSALDGKEGKGKEHGRELELSDSPEALTRSVPFLEFSVVGRGSKVWPLSDSLVCEWERDFPNLDVRAECRKARAWVEANPGRRKTASGMPRFLVNWLSRCTDRRSGGGRRAEDPPFTAAELKHAREVYKVRMGCRHDPRCAGGIGQCVELIAQEIREKARAS